MVIEHLENFSVERYREVCPQATKRPIGDAVLQSMKFYNGFSFGKIDTDPVDNDIKVRIVIFDQYNQAKRKCYICKLPYSAVEVEREIYPLRELKKIVSLCYFCLKATHTIGLEVNIETHLEGYSRYTLNETPKYLEHPTTGNRVVDEEYDRIALTRLILNPVVIKRYTDRVFLKSTEYDEKFESSLEDYIISLPHETSVNIVSPKFDKILDIFAVGHRRKEWAELIRGITTRKEFEATKFEIYQHKKKKGYWPWTSNHDPITTAVRELGKKELELVKSTESLKAAIDHDRTINRQGKPYYLYSDLMRKLRTTSQYYRHEQGESPYSVDEIKIIIDYVAELYEKNSNRRRVYPFHPFHKENSDNLYYLLNLLPREILYEYVGLEASHENRYKRALLFPFLYEMIEDPEKQAELKATGYKLSLSKNQQECKVLAEEFVNTGLSFKINDVLISHILLSMTHRSNFDESPIHPSNSRHWFLPSIKHAVELMDQTLSRLHRNIKQNILLRVLGSPVFGSEWLQYLSIKIELIDQVYETFQFRANEVHPSQEFDNFIGSIIVPDSNLSKLLSADQMNRLYDNYCKIRIIEKKSYIFKGSLVKESPIIPDIFDDQDNVIRSEELFRNKAALDLDFVPDELPLREEEIYHLKERIQICLSSLGSSLYRTPRNKPKRHAPFTHRYPPPDRLFITVSGPPGIGKTSIVIKSIRDIKENYKLPKDYTPHLQTVYIDCEKYYNQLLILKKILFNISGDAIDNQSEIDNSKELESQIIECIAKNNLILIVILDGMNVLTEDEIRALYLINYLVSTSRIMFVLIAELRGDFLPFGNYHIGGLVLVGYRKEYIQKIIKQRIDLAFNYNPLTSLAFELLVNYIMDTRNITYGITILRLAADSIEKPSEGVITDEFIKQQAVRVIPEIEEEFFQDLHFINLIVLQDYVKALSDTGEACYNSSGSGRSICNRMRELCENEERLPNVWDQVKNLCEDIWGFPIGHYQTEITLLEIKGYSVVGKPSFQTLLKDVSSAGSTVYYLSDIPISKLRKIVDKFIEQRLDGVMYHRVKDMIPKAVGSWDYINPLTFASYRLYMRLDAKDGWVLYNTIEHLHGPEYLNQIGHRERKSYFTTDYYVVKNGKLEKKSKNEVKSYLGGYAIQYINMKKRLPHNTRIDKVNPNTYRLVFQAIDKRDQFRMYIKKEELQVDLEKCVRALTRPWSASIDYTY